MIPGDIILINFSFTNPSLAKVRPAVIMALTADKYSDLIVCAISSIVPSKPSSNEILIDKSSTSFQKTGLRVDSVLKIDRISTLRRIDVITTIGKCDKNLWSDVRLKFRNLIK